jgi:transposase-like protein
MKCKHIWAVLISLGIRRQAKPKIILEPIIIISCPVCDSRYLKKDGIRHNKSGDLQRYRCLECGKKFSMNIGFEKIKHNPTAITAAMQLYFSGASLRNTQRSLELIGT